MNPATPLNNIDKILKKKSISTSKFAEIIGEDIPTARSYRDPNKNLLLSDAFFIAKALDEPIENIIADSSDETLAIGNRNKLIKGLFKTVIAMNEQIPDEEPERYLISIRMLTRQLAENFPEWSHLVAKYLEEEK